MRIFLTGPNGFLGKNILNRYSSEEMFLYSKNMNLKTNINSFRPDIIINCAAEIYNDESMWGTNVELVRDLLNYIVVNKDVKLIHFGSSSEYGILDRASTEKDSIDTGTMYGMTKGISSLLCQTYAKLNNLDVTVLRPYSLYGPHEKPHRLFPMLWKSFVKQKSMTLKEGVHDFLYINDFLDAIDLVINHKGTGEIYNVSSEIQTSNSDILKIFRLLTNKEGNIEFVNQMSTPNVWLSDSSKFKKKFNWSPKYNLISGITSFLFYANYE